MMQARKIVLILCCVLCLKTGAAQFYDRSWLIGDGTMVKLAYNSGIEDTSSFYRGTAAVTTWIATSNISDTAGNILFYTNGSNVGNSLAQLMENGDSLPDLLFYANFPNGFSQPQTNLILPSSGNTFYLFYISQSDSLFATNSIQEPDRLYYAVIDMNQNGGLGKVISKKNVAYEGLFGIGRLTACRHANGRDWWMVHQGFKNNEYFVYLVTPDSVYGPRVQHLGTSDFYQDDLAAQSVFSADGSKLATTSLIGAIATMGFDRCTGYFSNPDSISNRKDTFTYNGMLYYIGGESACFSPSGRFLYTSDDYQIFQFDTWAADVMGSVTVVGNWLSTDTLGFQQMYLLPNGQIIVGDGNGTGTHFHLIDSPDVQGTGCHFIFNGLSTSTLNANALPNMINYRLGALAGSSCDTLTGVNNIVAQNITVQVYPNPVSDVVQVDIANWDFGEQISFVLYDILGHEILRKAIPLYQIQVKRNSLVAGLYTWQIQNSTGKIKAAGKLVCE